MTPETSGAKVLAPPPLIRVSLHTETHLRHARITSTFYLTEVEAHISVSALNSQVMVLFTSPVTHLIERVDLCVSVAVVRVRRRL